MSRDAWAKKRANASDDNGWAERGGYMAAKVSKLDKQFKLDAPREKQKEGTCSSIFSGVAIFVNGYTEPSSDELRRLMMLHGGQFHMYYSRSKTTHIIASNLPNSKIQELKGEKVVRPDWITDSIKAGHLLPYLQYQLYVKQRGLTFTSANVLQASAIAGPSHGQSHQGVQQNHQPLKDSIQDSGLIQSSSTSRPCTYPRPLYTNPKHWSPLHAHPNTKSSSTMQPLITPRASLQPESVSSPQPQLTLSCNSLERSRKDLELKLSGSLQTSLDLMSHSVTNEMQECEREDEDDPRLFGATQMLHEAPLTNGHSHFNGALMPEDLSPVSDDTDLPQFRRVSPECKPASSVIEVEKGPDPYEFPHSPPKESSVSSGLVHNCNSQVTSEQCPKRESPSSLVAGNAAKTLAALPQIQLPCLVDSNPEKTPVSPSPCSLSRSSVRLNGSHHTAFLSDPVLFDTDNVTANPDSHTDQTVSSKSSAQLLAQTGGLISEFYSHSRYHQISTWRTGFSDYVNELHSRRRTAGGASFPGKEWLKKCAAQRSARAPGMSAPSSVKSCILHVDMDCFFVSVGIRHQPELKGKPVAVTSNRGHGRVPLRPGASPQVEQQYYHRKFTHAQPEREGEDLHRTSSQESSDSPTNGVDQDTAALSMAEIASCSYEARQAGVKNGMFFGKAKQLCPSLQSVPYDFEAYKDVALTMYEVLASYTHNIEALSCDEVLIDASAVLTELGISPEDLATAIRTDIKEKTGCSASVGMGSNILLARLATRKAKPDGQHLLKSEEVDDFIRDLSVTSLPGVGPVMGHKLAAMGVRSCGDLQQVSLSQLQKKFGPRTGQTLFRFCRGLDDRLVQYEKERKSVSAEMNYNIRFTSVDEAESFMTNLSMEVQRRLQEAGLRGRRVTLKVMVRKVGAPLESAKYGGHGICDNIARTVMLAQSTDSGQLIASAVIKLFHAMKLQVQDLRGVGIQVQLLDKKHTVDKDSTGPRTRSIKEMLLDHTLTARSRNRVDDDKHQEKTSSTTASSCGSSPRPLSPAEPIPGTSKEARAYSHTPKHAQTRLNLSIEVPSPSQVDRSVLEALPPELREQVEQTWTYRDGRPNYCDSNSLQPTSGPPSPPPGPPSVGRLVLQIPNQPDCASIVLELPSFSEVDPDVFAALPKELQDELRSAYGHVKSVQHQEKPLEQKNPLLQLKQPGAAIGIGRVKRSCKRKNAVSPSKKGPSPRKRPHTGSSPAKTMLACVRAREQMNVLKTENGPSASTSHQDLPEPVSKFTPRPAPTLAGACDLNDIKTLLREWVTTITDPMEEDILQVVKYCTDLIEDKDLEKLDLIIKYMKRLMQQSVDSVWSMAFDFILDNVQVVVQQTYGSILKVT
ncbi:DNA repair protein REV1 [Thalassophryne amazonica]|uniref:DNA repair protein REV1 n=1 Tax=Thalassophryne amazonica TaxID=390379 RepID=UPI00147244E6|nr:DNA repair protein REV1 [Thalassophryne amazonica]